MVYDRLDSRAGQIARVARHHDDAQISHRYNAWVPENMPW